MTPERKKGADSNSGRQRVPGPLGGFLKRLRDFRPSNVLAEVCGGRTMTLGGRFEAVTDEGGSFRAAGREISGPRAGYFGPPDFGPPDFWSNQVGLHFTPTQRRNL